MLESILDVYLEGQGIKLKNKEEVLEAFRSLVDHGLPLLIHEEGVLSDEEVNEGLEEDEEWFDFEFSTHGTWGCSAKTREEAEQQFFEELMRNPGLANQNLELLD